MKRQMKKTACEQRNSGARMDCSPWKAGAVWEVTGWVWRGLEPAHAPPPRRWPRVPTQLSLKITAPPCSGSGGGAVS